MNDTTTLLTRRADLAPASADRDARTVEVIWSTGAPVRRRDMAGPYVERLSLAPEAVDLSRLQGASVLDAHRQSAVRDVLGSVQSAAVDGQRGMALIRFSSRPEVEPLWQDVLSGILRHVSVGYSVEEWAETTESGARVLTAIHWTPHEISLVPTPADPGAHIRMETHMTDTTITPTPPEAQTRAAINTEIRSIARIVTRALHTTSDFPIILGDTVGRVLRDAYQAAPSGIRRLGRQTTARDFRAVNKIMLGEAPLLEKLNEHGEIKAGTMAEAREAYKIETWAKKIGITRQVLVNDDLGAFADLARRMGQGAAETEARILVTLLEANSGNGPTLSDSKALFHADHGNKAASGAAISDTTLSAARLALRTQKGIEGRVIRVTPKNLLVPPALETVAEKWLATIAPATAADVNPFSGAMSLVVEPRLSSATRWYVTADPGEIDGLEFAYLSGNEGPQVESRSGWDVDGVEIRVILDFGAGFIDHRGWFQNPGA